MALRDVLLARWLGRLARADRILTGLIRDSFAAMLKAARTALGPIPGQPDTEAVGRAARDSWDKLLPELVDSIEVLWLDTARQSLPETPTPVEEESLADRAQQYAQSAENRLRAVPDQVYETVRELIAEGIARGDSIPDLRDQVSRLLDPDTDEGRREWDWRAERIARTEVHAAVSAARSDAHTLLQEQTGRPVQREWLTMRDHNVRPSHVEADTQKVGVGESFVVGGSLLRYPGDPLAPAHETINCRCIEAVVVDGVIVDVEQGRDAMAADAAEEARQGAMIALIPTAEDAARLAVDGGLPVEELHLTLVFLGDATAWPEQARTQLLDFVRAERPTLAVDAHAWAAAAINPGTPDQCVAYLVGDDDGELSWVRSWALDVALSVAGPMLAAQHDPWVPHITGAYETADAGKLTEFGALTFDRLRIVFGDRAHDLPLDAPSEEPETDEALTVEADESLGALVADVSGMPPQLQRSYVSGKVAARIRWGTGGDFGRCVRQARKHGMGRMAEGACATLHHRATGQWPGKGRSHAAGLEDAVLVELPGSGGLYVSPAVAAAVTASSTSNVSQAASLAVSDRVPQLAARVAAGADPLVALIAAIPSAPPRSWFEPRTLDGATPVTITASGQIYGHLARWDDCHRGIASSCFKPPRTRCAYKEYMLGQALCADGSLVPIGKITLGGGHADLGLRLQAAREHYDDVSTHVASVHAWEDEYGIAVAGTLVPTITPDQLRSLLASPLSGDWRDHNDNLELVAALAVNTPGYAVPRAMAASGALVMETATTWELVDAGRVNVDQLAGQVVALIDQRNNRNAVLSEIRGLVAASVDQEIAAMTRGR